MKLFFTISLLFFLASCQKAFNEEGQVYKNGPVQKLINGPTACLSQTSSEMLLIMHKPTIKYYFELKNPTGSDIIRQDIFTINDLVPDPSPDQTLLQKKNYFPETDLMIISAKKDNFQNIPLDNDADDPIYPYFLHHGGDKQNPQFGVESVNNTISKYAERPNQIRPGEELIFKLGSYPVSKGLKMYGIRLFLRVPISRQLVIIDLYNDNTLVYSWRPPVSVTALKSIDLYELKLAKTQVFNEIHFRMQYMTYIDQTNQYAIRGAISNKNDYDALMIAPATAPRFFLTPEFPDLLYLVGSSSQKRATATGSDYSQEFLTNGSSTGPSYLQFSTTGSGASFAIDPIGRYGMVSAAEPTVGITENKPFTLTTGTDFYSNSNMSFAQLRLQNTGPIGTQALVEMLTAGDAPVGSSQTITFTATGQFKQVTLDPGTNFKKIRLTVPGGAPSNSSFVLNPSPPTTSPYQALTRFYPSCN